MSYRTQALLAQDQNIIQRITACASTQGIRDPQQWAWSRAWEFSAEPGWDDAYSYALNVGKTEPGNEEGVITDGMILASVQALRATEAPTS